MIANKGLTLQETKLCELKLMIVAYVKLMNVISDEKIIDVVFELKV